MYSHLVDYFPEYDGKCALLRQPWHAGLDLPTLGNCSEATEAVCADWSTSYCWCSAL